MRIIERGTGPPLVFIPGLQGRWEYQRSTVDALAEAFRVITFSLCDERTADAHFDSAAGMESYVRQVERALDDCRIERAAICGVSFGGLVALRFAAGHPHRAAALVIVSAPGPMWHLKPRHELYARAPLVFGPVFAAESPLRFRREIAAAFPDRSERRRFVRAQLRTLVDAPLSLRRMAARARLIATNDRCADALAVSCPTLVVHGDSMLDHVVDADDTLSYARLIPDAQSAVLNHTGHLGSITRPHEFATIVRSFLIVRRHGSHDTAA